MNQKNPLEPLLSQMIMLMELIQNHKEPLKEMPPELAKDIERLEQDFAKIEEGTRQLMKDIDIDPELLRIQIMRSPNVSDKDKRLLERGKMVERDAKILKTEIDKVIKKRKPKKSDSKTAKTDQPANKQEIKERRKRFKRIGSDDKWIPL